MGPRTCLLCGKPLSRIRTGSGEDFCSREHGNQYRLRRGMDRVLEANKVANAMRRRESPRQISAASLRSAGPLLHRGFLAPQRPSESRIPAFPLPQVRPARLAATSNFCVPVAKAGVERPIEIAAAALAFPAQPPLAPAIDLCLPAHVAQAPASAVAHPATDAESKRRVLILPWRAAGRTFVGESRKRAATASKTNPLESSRPALRVTAASKGRALRVSMAAGFRIPDWKLRTVSLARPEIVGMQWPELRKLEPAMAASPALPAEAAIGIAAPAMCIPAVPSPDLRQRLRQPGIIGVTIHFVESAPRRRSAFVPFGISDESLAKKERR